MFYTCIGRLPIWFYPFILLNLQDLSGSIQFSSSLHSWFAQLTRKSMRRILCNKTILRNLYAALRLQSTAEDRVFAVGQAGWLFPPPRSGSGFDEKQQLPVKKKKKITIFKHTRNIPLLLNDHDHANQKPSKLPGKFPRHNPSPVPAALTRAGLSSSSYLRSAAILPRKIHRTSICFDLFFLKRINASFSHLTCRLHVLI